MFAIGSPFNLSQTATMGIVSATGRNNLNITHGRNGKDAGYENFIQTDASINPGNSGGALLDSNGEVIGINTAIFSRGSGGNQGIGFAVPIDIAQPVMEQILSSGHVVRSRLGVGIQPIDAALAKSYGLPRPEGALVNKVEDGSPAEKAGIKPEDVIVEIDGRPVEDFEQLRLDISSRKPGSTIDLGLLRDEDGKQQRRNVTATLVEKRETDEPSASGTSVTDEDNALRGVEVGELDELSPRERQQLGLAADVQGVVITQIQHGSPAQRGGLQEGDVIQQIGHQSVKDAAAFKRLAKSEGKGVVRLRVQRGPSSLILALEP